jgi:hypothetical protein
MLRQLFRATRKGDVALIRQLLAEGPPGLVNTADAHGRTAMFAAVLVDDGAATLRCVGAAGGDVTVRDRYGLTPLQYAAKYNCDDDGVLQWFFQHPAITDIALAHAGLAADPPIPHKRIYAELFRRQRRWSALREAWFGAVAAGGVTPTTPG